ncbi:MAG: hypothetical protein QNJ13_03425 [Paracoccaceae bacterium]|nr:hypothetical protein [Paracoccaceae bacterium]
MQKLLLAGLVAGAGYFAWVEYGGNGTVSVSSTGSGGPGFSQFGKTAGKVAGSAVGAVTN